MWSTRFLHGFTVKTLIVTTVTAFIQDDKNDSASEDYNTDGYKYCSKVPPLVCSHLLTSRTVFTKTLFNIARSVFRMYSAMDIYIINCVGIILYSNHQVHRKFDQPVLVSLNADQVLAAVKDEQGKNI
jgi:hypothetical protein